MSKTYPAGGAKQADNVVTVYGTGFKILGKDGPTTRTGMNGIHVMFEGVGTVPGTYVNDWTITCYPPLMPISDQCGSEGVNVYVTLNDDMHAITNDTVVYSYYDL